MRWRYGNPSAGILALACGAVVLFTSSLEAREGTVYQDNIVVVIDASGSMKEPIGRGGTRMEAAKRALGAVIEKVPDTTNVGVLVFSGRDARNRALKNDWVYPLGPLDRDRMRNAVSGLQPDGKTPLGKYLKKGADRLLEQRTAQKGYGTFRLLVVTDGEAGDPNLVQKHLPDIMSRGIALDVIGVAMAKDHSLATRVHSYRSANDPDSLERAIAEVFAEIGSQDASATDEAFDLISGLPDGLAAGVIGALTAPRDTPIGQRARRAPAPNAGSTGTPAPDRQGGQSAPTAVPQPQKTDSVSGGTILALLFAGFAVFVAVVRSALKGGRRKGRRR